MSSMVTPAQPRSLQALAVSIGLLVAVQAGAVMGQSCNEIGGTTLCGGRSAVNTVGRTVIFNQGSSGRRIGDLTVIEEDGRSRGFRDASPGTTAKALLNRLPTAGPTGRLDHNRKAPPIGTPAFGANLVPRKPPALGVSRSRLK